MLKPIPARRRARRQSQPPSGGCVLKRSSGISHIFCSRPAAFRRLCVETIFHPPIKPNEYPAAFRRLCVETPYWLRSSVSSLPAAFRRLCVETLPLLRRAIQEYPAAFRRLCVETNAFFSFSLSTPSQPPSGGCVLKLFSK